MKPTILSAPHPRSLELIFTAKRLAQLRESYEVIEVSEDEISNLSPHVLAQIRYIIGQPPLDHLLLEQLKQLKCIFNVESNLMGNMPYDTLFERGIHVVTTGAVFAQPVAELALGLALDLSRQITTAHQAFENGIEKWGLEGNRLAKLLFNSRIGMIGFGDLGKALATILAGFKPQIKIYDPWLPNSFLSEIGTPSSLEDIFDSSDMIFVLAAVTTENQHFINADLIARMPQGSSLVLLSRAEVIDFPALINAVEKGHITAASDVWPLEPMPADHPVRQLPGFLKSAHRAGALQQCFEDMGEMVWEDLQLLDRGLPPLVCKRAQRETARKMQSKPVLEN